MAGKVHNSERAKKYMNFKASKNAENFEFRTSMYVLKKKESLGFFVIWKFWLGYQNIVKSTVSGVLQAKLKFSWLCPVGCLRFWSEPSAIFNLRSGNTPEIINFTIPWYQTWWNPYLVDIFYFQKKILNSKKKTYRELSC